jgi:hypothetical protein
LGLPRQKHALKRLPLLVWERYAARRFGCRYLSARRELGISDHTIDKDHSQLVATMKATRAAWSGRSSPKQKAQGVRREEVELRFVPAANPIGFRSSQCPSNSPCTRASCSALRRVVNSASVRAQRADLEQVPIPVRGSKRETRDRRVPVFLPWQLELLAYVAEHAQGKDGALFASIPPTTFNHALYAACDRVSARPVTVAAPLARKAAMTCGALSECGCAPGVAVSEIALMMGHRDSRMAEKVYARIPPEMLQALLRSLCQPAAGSFPRTVGKMGAMTNAVPTDSRELAPMGLGTRTLRLAGSEKSRGYEICSCSGTGPQSQLRTIPVRITRGVNNSENARAVEAVISVRK